MPSAPSPSAPVPAPAESPQPAIQPAPPATTVPAPAVATPAKPDTAPTRSPSAPSAAADAADPATLGQYRIAIIAAARRYKRYPRVAIDNNWEGQAEVRLVIGPDGTVASIAIKSASGYEVLDQQALEMIRKAKPLTPIPAALRGRGFTVDVPVVFSLKEEGG